MQNSRKKSISPPESRGHRDNPLLKTIVYLAAGGLEALTPTGDYRLHSFMARLLREKFTEENTWNEEEVRKSLYHLQRSKFIKYEVSDTGIKLKLTQKGQKRFDLCKFDDLAVEKPESWDGKWRIIVFDIPEKRRAGRNALRDKLEKLGFFRLQKSVLAYPYSCKDEIQFICEFFGIGSYVLYFETTLESDAQLKNYFGL